ncbi:MULTISPECIES: DUF805 domain-containing protein [Xanthobacter]|uniref:DUF805 domain-containing protein n=1 Tax=Xanthobacter TaxID=279 RepID=UPI00202304FB|nr:DUF805 domain-containing protein [Xanthobacter aminoxidans]MCL8380891.1 DUF805 domain-containing protein [Xanthobacter aminoxidans]
MTFTQAVRSCLSQYAGFQGRAPRSEFWWFWVFTLLMEIAAFVIGTMLLAGSITATQVSGGQIDAWYFFAGPNWLSTVVHLGLILPSLAVAVRRLHDIGRTGWWFLILFVPFGFFVLLFWWVQPSQREPNVYGPPLLPVR